MVVIFSLSDDDDDESPSALEKLWKTYQVMKMEDNNCECRQPWGFWPSHLLLIACWMLPSETVLLSDIFLWYTAAWLHFVHMAYYYIKSLLHNQYCREVALCVCLLCTRKSLVAICSVQLNGSNNRLIKLCCFQKCVSRQMEPECCLFLERLLTSIWVG